MPLGEIKQPCGILYCGMHLSTQKISIIKSIQDSRWFKRFKMFYLSHTHTGCAVKWKWQLLLSHFWVNVWTCLQCWYCEHNVIPRHTMQFSILVVAGWNINLSFILSLWSVKIIHRKVDRAWLHKCPTNRQTMRHVLTLTWLTAAQNCQTSSSSVGTRCYKYETTHYSATVWPLLHICPRWKLILADRWGGIRTFPELLNSIFSWIVKSNDWSHSRERCVCQDIREKWHCWQLRLPLCPPDNIPRLVSVGLISILEKTSFPLGCCEK